MLPETPESQGPTYKAKLSGEKRNNQLTLLNIVPYFYGLFGSMSRSRKRALINLRQKFHDSDSSMICAHPAYILRLVSKPIGFRRSRLQSQMIKCPNLHAAGSIGGCPTGRHEATPASNLDNLVIP